MTDHFTNIEIHKWFDTFFLMFQQLGEDGSTVNLMPINREFIKLQFDTKQSSDLEKKYARKKEHASGYPTLRGHGKRSIRRRQKLFSYKASVLYVRPRSDTAEHGV